MKITAFPSSEHVHVSQTPLPPTGPHWNAALDWWLRLQDQPADLALHRELRDWLAADPAHQAAFDKVQRVWQFSGALNFATPTPCRRRRRLYGVACAASLLLATVLLVPLFFAPDWRSEKGQHLQVRLEDGSEVLLASDSAIDVHFDANMRRVVLRQGRAFFSVQPDPSRPFLVNADRLRIQVTGTRFDVARYDSQITVEVASGSVRVAGEQVRNTADLGAGQRLSLRSGAQQWQQAVLPAEAVATWRDWQLLVRDVPLRDVVEQLRPYLPGLVLLPDAELADRHVTARLDLHMPEQALQAAVEAVDGQLRTLPPYFLALTR